MTAEVETTAIDWPDTNELPTAIVQLQAHYDGVRKAFWTKNNRGGWIEVNEQSLRRLLRAQGLRGGKLLNGEQLTPLEQKLNEIQTEHDVAYAGPLAGYCSGLTECCGQRILVTSSPTLISPVAGEWPVLRRYLDSLLSDDRYDQRQYLFAWLKIGYEALRQELWRGGPAIALAGPRGCGKSLLQNLFTLIFGGRSAKPYRYMSGGTQFNADLFGAEHLMIEDEHSSTDIRARRAFGSNIKQFTSNRTQSCHGKNRQALTLAPFWRVSISVNDEPEAMMVLPPMSDSAHDSLGDKIILLSAQKAEMPLPTVENEEWQTFWRTLIAELPAFLHFLVNWNIPNDLRHPRFGVQAWQHPRLLAALDALAPETRLLGLIDEEIFGVTEVGIGRTVPPSKWEGTAEKLERLLCDLNSPFSNEARRLLSWPSATGTYLGRLAHKHPDRVNPDRTSKARNWIIFRKPDSPSAVTP